MVVTLFMQNLVHPLFFASLIYVDDGERNVGGEAEWFDGEASTSGADHQPTEQHVAGHLSCLVLVGYF